jgi:hypothetical protein
MAPTSHCILGLVLMARTAVEADAHKSFANISAGSGPTERSLGNAVLSGRRSFDGVSCGVS